MAAKKSATKRPSVSFKDIKRRKEKNGGPKPQPMPRLKIKLY
jgi:hypothetical protein